MTDFIFGCKHKWKEKSEESIKEDITVPKMVNIEVLDSIMVTNNKNKETYF